MSFFSDLFGGADNAAQAQIQGIQNGLNAATGLYNQGSNALTTNYASALSPLLSNYGTATQGTTALGNLLGLNGTTGSNNAMTSLQATPGYQFNLGQGDNAINAAAAANGTLNSGNTLTALSKFNQGQAGNAYGNAVSSLSPYLSMLNSSGSGIGSLYSGLGGALNANDTGLGELNMNAYTGIGNAQASADLADQSMGLGLLGGALKLGASLIPGVGQLAAGLGSGFGLGSIATFSDERLKDDIEEVGTLFDGQPIYRYKYIDDPQRTHIGLIAQDVAETNPDAVHDIAGFLAVDYGAATSRAADLAKFLNAEEGSGPSHTERDGSDGMAGELLRFLDAA